MHAHHQHILKFYLHISAEEQLERFAQRLDDPMRNWKISEADYSERKLWPEYMKAYEDAIEKTSTKHAPWYEAKARLLFVRRFRRLTASFRLPCRCGVILVTNFRHVHLGGWQLQAHVLHRVRKDF